MSKSEDIRDLYDMDEEYNLLSWKIPRLNITIKIGDKFMIDGKEKTLTKMEYASDMLGIYSMYPYLDDEFRTLHAFVELLEKQKK